MNFSLVERSETVLQGPSWIFLSKALRQVSMTVMEVACLQVRQLEWKLWQITGFIRLARDLPIPILTYILYTFIDINTDTGKARFLSDTTADIEKPLSRDLSDKAGNNLYSCLKQLYLLKKLNQALKVLLSIDSWTYSLHFASPALTSQGCSTFALSIVSLIKTYGFDSEVRTALDRYRDLLDPPYHFTLTVACPGPYGYQYLNLSAISQTVDFLNVIVYNYTGPWSKTSGDQANLFLSSSIPASTPFNTEAIISYILQSIRLDKITLGIPLYSCAFNNTSRPREQFSGSYTYDFKELPLNRCTETNDNKTGLSYCYRNRELISYNSILVVHLKAAFIQNKSLSGTMF
ncbi:hypothetical protein OIDMADRAFT_46392 [Oidiodendron maius Zn]|uniref:chitinase n=1 Tax=Oidiodendron maius (strain Zn) TaxID=913774 RepID=A0A0C3GA46_OIDMZ|nr:hypothetical protein OIDMADRAFT_46392 [Oidiodendron maius Zn]